MEGITYILFLDKSSVFYIGSTSDIQRRIREHLQNLKTNKHKNANLQKAWNISKSEKIKAGIIYKGTLEEARRMETREIQSRFGDVRMANIGMQATGGDNFSRHPDIESIRKNKKKAMRKYFDNRTEEQVARDSFKVSGVRNPMYGKTHSPATKEKLSLLNTGHSYNKGIKLSLAHRAKISEMAKKRIGSKNPFYGKTHSEKTKAILRQKLSGLKPPNCNKLRIGEIVYSSQQDAALALGVTNGAIAFRLRSKNPKFSEYKLLKQGGG